MSLLTSQSRDPATRALRHRVLNVLPAVSFQMQKLFSLLDLRLSDAIPSACIECKETPAMLFNPGFLATHCRADGDFFLLIMHELYHHILGHTRMFPRATRRDNIVFDALINALLCRQFHATAGTGLFTRIYNWDSMPERLLRPPPDWSPHAASNPAVDALPAAQARVIRMLYLDPANSATCFDLYRLLRALPLACIDETSPGPAVDGACGPHGPATLPGGTPLLGSHATPTTSLPPVFTTILRGIVAGWPSPPIRIHGRDDGTTPTPWAFPAAQPTAPRFRSTLLALLTRCGSHAGQATALRRRCRPVAVALAVDSFLPQAKDRQAPAIRAITGSPPLLYRATLEARRPRQLPQPQTHVYLDVSGSMDRQLPAFTAVLAAPLRAGHLRLFVFSTLVEEVHGGNIAKIRVENSRGTNINCVLAHLAGLPPRQVPRHVVVLSDGDTGPARLDLRDKLRQIRFHAGLLGAHPGPTALDWMDVTLLPDPSANP